MASTVILARHGQTDWNVQNRTQGHQGAPLNERGREQAQALASQLLSDHPEIDLILSSDLERARQTAEIVAGILQLPVSLDPRLRECAFGKLEGLTPEEILHEYGEALRPAFEDYNHDYDFNPYAGESRLQVVTRHTSVFDELERATDFEKGLLVGHGRSFNNVLSYHWPGTQAIKGNCEYRTVPLPAPKTEKERAAFWAAQPTTPIWVEDMLKRCAADNEERAKRSRPTWESLQRPVDF